MSLPPDTPEGADVPDHPEGSPAGVPQPIDEFLVPDQAGGAPEAPPPPPEGFAPPPDLDVEFGFSGGVDLPPPPPTDLGAPPPPPPGAGGVVPGTGPAAPAPAPGAEVAPARARMVKYTQDATRAERTTAVVRRYLWVAAVLAVAIVVANVVPSVGSSTASTGVSADGITPATPQYGSGNTVAGEACGAGVRQVAWSHYAPPCQPAWHGKNGGATSRGVTSKSITVAYRLASSAQLAEIYAITPPSVVGSNASTIETLQAYIDLFNHDYELYGRQVKLATFTGKSDFVDEDLGEDQAQAQEDSITEATSLKAFADMSLFDASALYASDLAAQQVVTSTLYENAESWYKGYAPYVYSPGPNCSKGAQATGDILGKQLGGLPADHAGPGTQGKKRTFGIIYTEDATYETCADEEAAAMAASGHPVIKKVGVKFDLSSLIATADQAVASLKAAGVTTIILQADPITPRFYMEAADADHYYPEWWFLSDLPNGQTDADGFTQLFPADQTRDIIGLGSQTQPVNTQEAVTAFKLGKQIGVKEGNIPANATISASFFWAYPAALQLFDALQLAGPDLTPATFESAMSKIPASSPGGMFNGWDGAAGPYDPTSSFSVVAFDPDRVSPLNGKPGTYVACDGGKVYPFDGAGVPAHRQLTCAGG